VEAILKVNNIRIDLQYQIEGETIQEQIAWLEKEIVLLQNRINAAKGQLAAMISDKDIQSKRRLLNSQEKQEQFIQSMEAKIETLKEQRDALDQEIDAIKGK
jgi:predicted  nucleic acid-binding Zn-ribbon protein